MKERLDEKTLAPDDVDALPIGDSDTLLPSGAFNGSENAEDGLLETLVTMPEDARTLGSAALDKFVRGKEAGHVNTLSTHLVTTVPSTATDKEPYDRSGQIVFRLNEVDNSNIDRDPRRGRY